MRKNMVVELAEQADEPEDLPPFERFKDLTKRLIAVPKTELDALREAEQRAKRKRSAPPDHS